ncbi:hypothetical protein [Micromonospora sp. U21]|nr:hypothetical protein [Micromonospora sp. U21]MBQ0902410.1 hypothetical protein [Micromonospora sp. U21]
MPAEVRCRPLARTEIAEIARAHSAPAGVARLAALVGPWHWPARSW